MLLAKGWNIIKFLSSIKEQMGSAATWIVAIIGMIMFIVGIWLIAKGSWSDKLGSCDRASGSWCPAWFRRRYGVTDRFL